MSNIIVFENAGEIDVRSITSFGVSVKEGDNPIGFFGTGLKYAIAVLLRTEHQVTVHSGLSTIVFGTAKETIRGKEFDFVTMAVDGGAPASIGFTTELGKQWHLWMAYRELACNCKDESGVASAAAELPIAVAGQTKIVVQGGALAEVHAERHRVMLEDEAALVIGSTEVRRRSGNDFFYRGVRVHQFAAKSLFTYNDTNPIELTEDRTVKHGWEPDSRVRRAILRTDNDAFIRECLLAPRTTLEGALDFHGYGIAPSEAFLRVVGDCVRDRLTDVNPTAVKLWKETTRQEFAPLEVTLSVVQLQSLNRALDFCERIGFVIRGAFPIKVCESLGEGVLGMAKDRTIYLAEQVFSHGGSKLIASTLIEEFVHLRHGYRDETRQLQDFFLDKLVSIGEELVGEPL